MCKFYGITNIAKRAGAHRFLTRFLVCLNLFVVIVELAVENPDVVLGLDKCYSVPCVFVSAA